MPFRVLPALALLSLMAACSATPAAPKPVTLGGTVTGLAGTGLVLQDQGQHNLTVTQNGPFSFAGTFASGAAYFVTVGTQPTGPAQTCTIASAQGTLSSANVTNIAVTCTTETFTVGGSVTGLVGTGLALQDNGGDNLTVAADGTFTFATPLAGGAAYAVTVQTQPAMPAQTCTVTNGTGSVGTAAVTNVLVTCVTNAFTIGGTVSGLMGTGLVLQNNGGDSLMITSGSTFTFATKVAAGATYAVTVGTQPTNPTQTCVVSGGSGTVVSGNVTSITVNCASNTYTIGGVVLGLAGTGLVLQDNGGDTLNVTANGQFAFATPIASGGAYAVTISSQPLTPTQTCTVTGGSGTVSTSNVASVSVTCTTSRFSLSGTIKGLKGSGLVLQDNGGDDTMVQAGSTTFSFMMPLDSGATYSVQVATQPSSPSQTCVVSNDAQGTVGNAAITDIAVTCTTELYTVGGAVTGLTGTGLVLQDNGGDNLMVTANGLFTFATQVASGAPYTVTVLTQPSNPAQTCTVTSGTGTVATAVVASVVVNCATSAFTIGGSVSGVMGTGLVLEDNGGDDLSITSGSTFVFAKPVPSGGTYAVTVKTQPSNPTQTCVVSGGSGTVVNGNVTSVTVNCASNTYTVGGVVLGMAGTGLVLQDNGGDNLSVSANGLFAFATPIASGGAYAVTVLTQPTSPTQTCTVTGATGTVATSNVTSVSVSCTTNTYALSGTLSGLSGTGLVLQNNGGDSVTVTSGATTFAFMTALPSGASYSIQVASQPSNPSQTCVVSNDAHGVVGSSAITDIAVTCATGVYTVGGTVTGLVGSGLVLQDNGGDNNTIMGNGVFTFATPIGSGNTYAVTILTQPSSPAQSCTVSGGSGTVVTSNITTIVVNCSTNDYTVGGTTVGLMGSGLQLSLNGLSGLSVSSNGAFSFPQTLAAGSPYAVTILSQPTNPAQTCNISGGAGTVGSANVTSVVVNCGTNSFTVGGAITGLSGSGLVLQDNGGDNLSVTANGLFSFATPLPSGSAYAVTVLKQPKNPTQTCTVTSGSGTVVTSNITTVVVACTANTYTVSGTISGLNGTGLVLQDNGGDNITITEGAPTFAFPTALPSGVTYAVSVATQPSGPGQTCVVSSNATGMIGTAPVTNVAVTCTTNTYSVGGTVVGLLGTGMVLQDNAGDNLTISKNGAFTFATPIASGGTFDVTVLTQPSTPAQTCQVTGATGSIVNAAVQSVTVDCGSNSYTVSGAVSGLAGSGLVLALNAESDVTVESNGSFSFPQVLTDGSAYTVTILTQPTMPTQTCTLSGASGTIAAANVSNVAVTCGTNSFPITVNVSGVAGSGLVLENNGRDSLSAPSSGSYTFPTLIASGAGYAVTVGTQPTDPTQTCTVSSGSGTVAGAAVSNVNVSCSTNKYTVNGTVLGLTGTVVLQDDGTDTLIVAAASGELADGGMAADGGAGDAGALEDAGSPSGPPTAVPFTFATAVASGGRYAVTVSQQPGSPSQTCVVTGDPKGTIASAAVDDVVVTCTTNTFSVDVTVVGLLGTGLVIGDNVGDMVTVTGNGALTLPTKQASATTYAVTVLTQPTGPAQTCSVLGGTGMVGASNVTGITVNCGVNSYGVSGTVSGLTGSGLIVSDNVGDTVPISGNGTFSFPTPYASGAPYSVSVSAQPQDPWQNCTVTNASGTIATSSVTNVAINCTTDAYTVSVSVTGLSGSLELLDNGSDTLSMTQDGVATFPTAVPSEGAYAVTVLSQPTSPWQTCTVTDGTGTIAGANVTIAVSCTSNTYTVSVAVTGLSGSGLQLLDDGSDSLAVTGNGSFTFPTSIQSGSLYDVVVATQPSGPTQACVVSSPSGTMGGSDVTLAVACSTAAFTVGGTVIGLASTEAVQLSNGSDTITVDANGLFAFDTPVASGATYSVSIAAQPASPVAQTCTVGSGSGVVGAANVTSVTVSCVSNAFTIGGTLSGYAGSGLVLQDNGGDDLTVSAGATTFTFPTALASGVAYSASVLTQPTSPSQTCSVSSGTGTTGTGNVTNIAISCTTNTYTVGGTVSGLASMESVQLSNGSDTITVGVNGLFAFDVPVASGASYSVTVAAQPSSPVTQTCTVSSGGGVVGAGAVTSVAVVCVSNKYTIGGTLSGYSGSGLVLQDNGGDNLTVSAGATTFTFATARTSGASYAVSVLTQPTSPWQTCTVSSGTGSIPGANVTSVSVSCTTNTYTVGGTISGLAGGSLILQDNSSSNTVTLTVDGTFQFPADLSGNAYAVTVQTQPSSPTQTCAVMNGVGTIGGAAVTNVAVTCSTSALTVGGTLTGYAGSGLQLQLNGTNTLTVGGGATSFTFGVLVDSGQAYAVTVLTQPSSPTQTCTVSSGTGTVGSSNVTSVGISCTTSTFTVGGTITGLASGNGLVLQDNTSSNAVTVMSDGTFQFSAQASGSTYAVTVQTQPSMPVESCTVTNGTGTVTSGPVTNIAVACSTTTFTVGGTISGYSGSGLQVQLNGANTLPVMSGATSFVFSSPVASGTPYAVTVSTQPSSPTQSCSVSSGTGTVGSSNITSVSISCSTGMYAVGGVVSGLASSTSVVLQDNVSSNTVTVMANGAFAFPAQASGSSYAVTVQTQPSNPTQSCTVANGTGSLGSAPVTNIVVSCTTTTYTVGGTISGYSGSGLQLLLNGANAISPSSGATSFTFSTAVASNGTYAVSVGTQPSSPTASCTIANASGTVTSANITNVAVACTTATYTVGGTVAGLAGAAVVLQDNTSSNTVSVSTDGTFQFPAQASGSSYAVTVKTQPSSPTQVCTVTNGTGTVSTAPITNIAVSCSTSTFTVGGSLSSYAGSGLVLLLNGQNNLTVSGGASSFTFSTALASGTPYAVTIATQPSSPMQLCSVSSGTGTVGAANVTSVSISCSTGSYTVGGTVTGLSGNSVVLQNNSSSNTVTVSSNGSFSFPAQASGSSYSVSVTTSPTSPAESCAITNGSGTVGTSNITNVVVVCSIGTYTVGGSISGLTSKGLILFLNGSIGLSVSSGATSFVFGTSIASGTMYTVTVAEQPSGPPLSCTVSNATGTVAGANVTNVSVACSTAYSISSGWLGSLGTRPPLINTTAADGGAMTMQIVNDGFEMSTLVAGAGTTASPYKVQACSGGDGGMFCVSGGLVP